jgi:hypothetical protein
MEKIKKLSLDKEILVSLQQKQMKSLIGRDGLYTGPSHGFTCNMGDGTCNPPPLPEENLPTDPLASFETNAISCCKKTCRD